MITVDDSKLTPKEREFVAQYLYNGGNGPAAYRHAFKCELLKDNTVSARVYRLLKKPTVIKVLDAHREQASRATTFTVTDVFKELIDLVTADPGELMAHRHLCCRYCYGRRHAFQWRDQQELAEAIARRVDNNARAKKGAAQPLPDEAGGFGFKPTMPPASDCPRCGGEGVSNVWFADTRYLSPKARKLFAGVKQTKEGLQILTRSQDGALALLMRAMGMLKETPPDAPPGAPLPEHGVAIPVPTDPIEAARLYSQIMKGSK